MKTKFNFLIVFLAVFMFSACTTVNQKGTPGQAQSYFVHYGKITSINEVSVNNETESTLGALIGGVAGAALGSAFGGGTGRVAAVGLGAVAGTAAGAAVGGKINGKALEIIVDTDKGQTLSVIERPDIQLHVGQRVRVLLGNNFSRIEPL